MLVAYRGDPALDAPADDKWQGRGKCLGWPGGWARSHRAEDRGRPPNTFRMAADGAETGWWNPQRPGDRLCSVPRDLAGLICASAASGARCAWQACGKCLGWAGGGYRPTWRWYGWSTSDQ